MRCFAFPSQLWGCPFASLSPSPPSPRFVSPTFLPFLPCSSPSFSHRSSSCPSFSLLLSEVLVVCSLTDLSVSSFLSEFPSFQRCPLGSTVLKVKLLDMGEPRALLATALSPPSLSDIERTVLLLKEVGLPGQRAKARWRRFVVSGVGLSQAFCCK